MDRLIANKERVSCILPPPNVTGSLHIGHALNISLQDIKMRHLQQKGFLPYWISGTDHAGIATQLVAQRLLSKDGIDYRQMSTHDFKDYIWKVKANHENIVCDQVRQMDTVINWDAYTFTLDAKVCECVFLTFKKLFDDKLLYQGMRLTHWDPKLKTALSDLEVEYRSVTGALYHIEYMLEDVNGSIIGSITTATTRPETMLGDNALCVHPDDDRYSELVKDSAEGKVMAVIPLTGKRIPIVTDEGIEKEFGTGVLKVTSAHAEHDYEIARRLGLECINMIDLDGCIIANEETQIPVEFNGMSCDDARKLVVQKLEANGQLKKTEQIKHQVPYGEKSGNKLECLLTKQWFVNMRPIADESLKYLSRGEIKFYPDYFKDLCEQSLEKIEPWCISRQLVWGHRIPIWYLTEVNHDISVSTSTSVSVIAIGSHDSVKKHVKMFVARNIEEAISEAARLLNISINDMTLMLEQGKLQLEQDKDVLDTWFSSALWPFATQEYGCVDNAKAYANSSAFIPNDFLVTGKDILLFWVAKMIMMTIYMCKQVPFKEVYLHGLVMDAQGKKMSKMVGNVLNPLDIINEYNSDVMKLGLISKLIQGRNVSIGKQNMELERNFLTKVENALKFCNMQAAMTEVHHDGSYTYNTFTSINAWILRKLNETIDNVDDKLARWEMSEALDDIRKFFRDDFCDWFIEVSKFRSYVDSHTSEKTLSTLQFVMNRILQLLYPFAPMSVMKWLGSEDKLVSWKKLKYEGYESELINGMNKGVQSDIGDVTNMGDIRAYELFNIIREVRSMKALGFKQQFAVNMHLLQGDIELLEGMTKMKCVSFDHITEVDSYCKEIVLMTREVIGGKSYQIKFFVDDQEQLDGIRVKCEKELAEYIRVLTETERRLADANFLANADSNVVSEMRLRLVEFAEYKKNREFLIKAIILG